MFQMSLNIRIDPQRLTVLSLQTLHTKNLTKNLLPNRLPQVCTYFVPTAQSIKRLSIVAANEVAQKLTWNPSAILPGPFVVLGDSLQLRWQTSPIPNPCVDHQKIRRAEA